MSPRLQHWVCKSAESKGRWSNDIYIKDSLLYSLRHDLAIQSNYYESLFIEIQNENTKNIIIGLIYRPPGLNLASFTYVFSEILTKIASEKKTCYLLGDYNVNLLNYETHVQCNDFLNALYGYSFRPLIDKPTRITSKFLWLITFLQIVLKPTKVD